MNTKNNKRRRKSIEKIKKAFIDLLQTNDLQQVTVSDICKATELNRSTFYANFADIYELADTMRKSLEDNMAELYREEIESEKNSNDYLRLFRHISENQIVYRTYFKLGYDNKYKIVQYDTELAKKHFDNRFINYHCEFFRGGLTTIIKIWLAGGCKETPEEMYEVICAEYKGR